MDELSAKRSTSVVGFSRRRSSFSFRQPKNDNGGTPGCNRLGCSTRYNSNKATEVRSSEKLKSLKTISIPSSKASNGSINRSSSHNLKKLKKQRNVTSAASSTGHEHIDDSVSRSRFMDVVEFESVDTVTENRINSREEENGENQSINHFSADVSEKSENSMPCKVTVKSNYCKQTNQQTGSSNNQDISLSSVRCSVTSRSSQTTRPSQGRICSTRRNGIRNLTCASRSDVSSGCSSMKSTPDNRTKRNSPNGGTSTSTSKSRIGSLARGSSDSQGKSAVKGPSIAKRLLPEATSRTRNQSARRDVSTSIRTLGANVERCRLSEPCLRGQGLHMQSSVCERTTTRQLRLSHRDATIRRPSFSNGIAHRQRSYHDNRRARVHPAPTSVADSHDSQSAMDGNSQVPYALDMIGQGDLAHEHFLALERNFWLASVEHDQHRDMRLDIDDMSYEELLALGEQMGTVSTALTEETLPKCLERSFYEHASMASGNFNVLDIDIKCSICQEEYAEGEEVGKLWCEHLYHVHCIHQWLRLKNWCPICKASALPS